MFARLGRFAADHARAVLAIAVLLMVGAGALGVTAFGKLQSQGFTDPGAESSQAQRLLDRDFGGGADFVLLVRARTGTVDDPAVRTAGTGLAARAGADRDLSGVTSYWQTGAPALKSADGRSALIVARTAGQDQVAGLVGRYQSDQGPVTVTVGGGAVANAEVSDQVAADLLRAETIAVPIIAVLLVIVFGGLVAALLPLVVGGIAVLGTFAELSVLGSLTDVSVFAINLTTALGLGLGIDYALLTVNRFREELAAGGEAQDVVRQIRARPASAKVLVGGDAAVLVDSKYAISGRLPLAAGLIAVTTFVLLFLFTGSVLQPVRALLFNLLSLSATLGLMVLVFQHGFLSSLLGFTPLPLDTSMLMLLFCITFGLSMDYEVFVISRIKEARDHGAGPREAVLGGLARSGRIVSAAAVLLAVSLFAFGTSGVSFIQMFGLGAGLAVLIDATLVRGVLLPAGMRLMGRHAWWSPAPLRRLHDRIGLAEDVPVPAGQAS